MTAGLRLKVDPIACDGRGLCAELLPGLITLDDWGFPLISSQDVPAALHGEASAAVQLCPRLALRLDTSEPQRAARTGLLPSSPPTRSPAEHARRPRP